MLTAGPATADPPWVVPLVVVLIVAGAVLIGGALAVAARSGSARGWRPFADDDLPRFAEAPPGFPTTSSGYGATTGPGYGATTGAVAVVGVLALLAAVVLAVVVATHAEPRPAAHESAAETMRLRFGGVVLEQRAVGVTVTYPQVSVRTDSRGTTAHLRLPTFNCLTDAPPADPLAAGCVRSLEEFADLTTPRLSVVHQRNGALRLTGRFATYVRPNGSPPEYTGRVYPLTVTARPGGTAAEGAFRLGG